MKREILPVLPEKMTERVLNILRLRSERGENVTKTPPECTDFADQLRRFDKDLFLKFNMFTGSLEVWERQGGKAIDDDRHKPNDKYCFSCKGLYRNQAMDKVWDISIQNPKNRSIEEMLEAVDKHNEKIEKESLLGTDEQREETRYNVQKKAVDSGLFTKEVVPVGIDLKGGK